MALLDILHFPDPRLRIKAKPVPAVTDATRRLIKDMLETMYAAPGIGLAAVQVGVAERLIVVDVSDDGEGGADPDHGSGLCGLRDRVETLNGHLEVESPCGRGTRIRADLPVP